MAHVKLITPGSQDFHEPVSQLIKLSSRGLLGSDRSDFVKRASALFAHLIDGLTVHPDMPLVHLLAMGATEDYGMNRNGDGFKRANCQRCHPSFVKYARLYRDHANKDTEKSYGLVKLSAYNPSMHRVELVVGLNHNQEEAHRNGGLVADREMTKLAAGKEIPVSMACRVPFDVCSWCGNEAPSRADYCDSIANGGLCKAGGLMHNIGSLVDMDGVLHQLHADNPDPTFFDISHVFRPADRIAFMTGMLKRSSAGVISGAELAEAMGVTVPYMLLVGENLPSNVQRMFKRAYQLADYEPQVAAGIMPRDNSTAFLASEHFIPPPGRYREKFAEVLRAMADARICLPLPQFIAMTTNQPLTKAAATAEVIQRQLPGIYSRLLTRDDFETRVRSNPYTPAPAASQTFHKWAHQQAPHFSIETTHIVRRMQKAALHGVTDIPLPAAGLGKTAMARDAIERFAEEYALYKLAFLCAIPESDQDSPLTASMLILQNHAS